MEAPYPGRAIIEDNFSEITITIPEKKNLLAISFLSVWLCAWLFGEIFALGNLPGGPIRDTLFMTVWISMWTFGGFMALRALIWKIKGKQEIIFSHNTLTINLNGKLFGKPKTYNLNDAKNFRVYDDGSGNSSFFERRDALTRFADNGIIRFDYGFSTVKFAADIDEAEAKHMLNLLREKKFIPAADTTN